ncbi:MAG: helix-turn-helix domain-containing protein [Acidimicrobiales bacterium]
MGYRGKTAEQERARSLRAEAWTLAEIAAELGVSKSSVSVWVRDVEFEPRPRRTARRRAPNRLQIAKQAEIEACRVGLERIGSLSDRDLLIAGTALYAGEGAKRRVRRLHQRDPAMIVLFCVWLRGSSTSTRRGSGFGSTCTRTWTSMATEFWSELVGIPEGQFQRPYRAVADPTMRRNRHEHRCLRAVRVRRRTEG